MDEGSRLWSKDFILSSLINFFFAFVFYLLIVTTSGYAVEVYGASTGEAGLVSSIFSIGALLGRLLLGPYMERIGYKKMLMSSIVLFILISCFYFIHLNIGFLLLTRFLHGMMLGLTMMIVNAMVAHIIPAGRKGEGIGYYSLSTIFATAFGPFLGILLIHSISFELLFAGCIGLSLCSLFVASFIKSPVINIVPAPMERFSLKKYIEPRAVPISLVVLVTAFCYSSVLTYLSFYATQLNLVKTASLFFITYSIAILLSRPFTGKLLDRKGANYVMYPAIILFAIGMFILSIADNSTLFLLSSVFIGLGFGNIQSCAQAISVNCVPPEKIGLSTATNSNFMNVGLGFGPYLLGTMLGSFSYSQMYAGLSVIILLTVILYTMIYAKPEKKGLMISNARELGVK